jgi:hypothetical protein
VIDLGTVRPGSKVWIPVNTFDSNDPSASVTATDWANTDCHVHKDGGTTQRASSAGETLSINFDTITGNHLLEIDLADNTTANFYEAGSTYHVRIEGVTVDAAAINAWIGMFRIGYPGAILDTTIATLASQTSFTLEDATLDASAYVGCPCIIHDLASAVQLAFGYISAYAITTKTVTLAADPGIFTMAAGDNISIFPPAQVASWNNVPLATTNPLPNAAADAAGGLPISDLGGLDLDTILDVAVSTRLAPTVAARTLDVSVGGEAGIDWANIGSPTTAQNVSATNIDVDQIVASVSGNVVGSVGSVTGAVGSVTGAVGSVAGNVDGNVSGTVASVVTKTGYALSSTGADLILKSSTFALAMADAIWDELLAGHVTADTAGLLLNEWQDGGRLDLILDARMAEASINTTGGAVDTVTTVTGAVGSVTGAVGSVTGAVGSVAGNVDGNVSGTVASVVTKTGYALSSTGADLILKSSTFALAMADAIWDELLAGHVTADTAGLLLNEWQDGGRLDLILDARMAEASIATTGGAVDTVTTVTGAVGSVTGAVGSVTGAVGSVAGNVDGNVSGTVADLLAISGSAATADRLQAWMGAFLTGSVEEGGGPTTTVFQTDAAEASDDHFNNSIIVFTGGNLLGQARRVSDYTGATGTFTVEPALTEAPAAADTWINFPFVIGGIDENGRIDVGRVLGTAQTAGDLAALITTADAAIDVAVADLANGTDGLSALKALIDTAQTDLDVITDADGVILGAAAVDLIWDETMAGHVTADTAGLLLNEWQDGGRLDAILDARASQATADAIETDTQDIQSRLPAALIGGRMDSDVEAINNDTDAADKLAAHALETLPVTFSAGGSTTTAVLNQVDGAGASATNDVYNGRILVFNNGTLNHQVAEITDYDGGTLTATISAVTTAPGATHTARMI